MLATHWAYHHEAQEWAPWWCANNNRWQLQNIYGVISNFSENSTWITPLSLHISTVRMELLLSLLDRETEAHVLSNFTQGTEVDY